MLKGTLTRNDSVDDQCEMKDAETTDRPRRCRGIIWSSGNVKDRQVFLAVIGHLIGMDEVRAQEVTEPVLFP
jgi:hypothetical protein